MIRRPPRYTLLPYATRCRSGPALGLAGTAICRLNTKKTADPVGNRKGREASDFHIMPHSDAAHIRLQGETKRYVAITQGNLTISV